MANEERISIKEALDKINSTSRDIIITLPYNTSWDEYAKELRKVADYSQVMNFKVANFPKGVDQNSRCYIVHQGFIKGWMKVVGFTTRPFTCSTTGKEWDGKFIQRSGPFHEITEKLPMRGFQGFRYFSMENYLKQLK